MKLKIHAKEYPWCNIIVTACFYLYYSVSKFYSRSVVTPVVPYRRKFRRGKFSSPSQNSVTFPQRKITIKVLFSVYNKSLVVSLLTLEHSSEKGKDISSLSRKKFGLFDEICWVKIFIGQIFCRGKFQSSDQNFVIFHRQYFKG